MNKVERNPQHVDMANVLTTIGSAIRRLRVAKGMTLQTLSEQADLSVSMLSLIERGKTSPSIGTLVVLASTLGVEMTELLGNSAGERSNDIVSRSKHQKVVQTNDGVTRRIVKTDRTHGLEIAVNEYDPATASSQRPVAHEGFEYGIVLQGELQVTLNGIRHSLLPGDLISYPSTHPHRIANVGSKRARALWINLRKS